MKRYGYIVGGQVQGVGFRPFVYRVARRLGLTGHVGNTSEGVRIEVQGEEDRLAAFERALHDELPPLARITAQERSELTLAPEEATFSIAASEGHHGHAVLVSPDVATCARCLRDMRDPTNRRYRYPFTNCTDCGPRYTITRSIPYDRASTSMSCFPLCPECAAEYADPENRRFHAQPNACSVCGPHVRLTEPTGTELAIGQEAMEKLAELLAAGHIAAVKGLGGFHLVCSAVPGEGDHAIAALRERKQRPHKALAIMVPDLETAKRVAELSPVEAAVLESPEHPIVSLHRLPGILPDALAPDLRDIGLMLPYTPLHHLLLEAFSRNISGIPALVMTSGNAGGEPIALGNREALRRLSGIADCFLLHDRDILVRADDSVVRVEIPFDPKQDALSVTPPRTAAEAPLHFFRRARDYLSTAYALDSGLPVLRLQHHFAHIYGVLAEHGHEAPALGLALDGTGYGPDGTIWGGELLYVHPADVHSEKTFGERLGRLSPFPLPGGEAAIREPWRIAAGLLGLHGDAFLLQQLAEQGEDLFFTSRSPSFNFRLLPALLELIGRGSAPLTSSCGRLFDAAAALLGLCPVVTYEGQAAIRLEEAQEATVRHASEPPSGLFAVHERNDLLELDVPAAFRRLFQERLAGIPIPLLARRFHTELAEGLADLALAGARRTGIRTVAMAGGVLHNRTLAVLLPAALLRRGLVPLLHRSLPPGDGSIAYGQAAWAVRVTG